MLYYASYQFLFCCFLYIFVVFYIYLSAVTMLTSQSLHHLATPNALTVYETRNTFYGTRYLSHCCVLFCIKTFFL